MSWYECRCCCAVTNINNAAHWVLCHSSHLSKFCVIIKTLVKNIFGHILSRLITHFFFTSLVVR